MKVNNYLVPLSISGIVAGLILVIAGVILFIREINGFAGACFSGGWILFMLSSGYLMNRRIELKHPEIARRKNIEVNDERNTFIREKAGSKTFWILQWILLLATILISATGTELYITLTMSGIIVLSTVVYWTLVSVYQKQL